MTTNLFFEKCQYVWELEEFYAKNHKLLLDYLNCDLKYSRLSALKLLSQLVAVPKLVKNCQFVSFFEMGLQIIGKSSGKCFLTLGLVEDREEIFWAFKMLEKLLGAK